MFASLRKTLVMPQQVTIVLYVRWFDVYPKNPNYYFNYLFILFQPCPVRALCGSVRLVLVPLRLARSREGRSSHHSTHGNSGCGLETGGQVAWLRLQ